MFGGVQAVTWTDVKQMVLILGRRRAAVVTCSSSGCPRGVGLECGASCGRRGGQDAGARLPFDLNETYTFWSGLIGGLFLALSYFGCDQSQVQRYLTAQVRRRGPAARC